MRKPVLTDAKLFHMGDMNVLIHRKKPPPHREEKGGHTSYNLSYSHRTKVVRAATRTALLTETIQEDYLSVENNETTETTLSRKSLIEAVGISSENQEGHNYNLSHYFITMEITESASPHL